VCCGQYLDIYWNQNNSEKLYKTVMDTDILYGNEYVSCVDGEHSQNMVTVL
jgi:hypothetical protein